MPEALMTTSAERKDILQVVTRVKFERQATRPSQRVQTYATHSK